MSKILEEYKKVSEEIKKLEKETVKLDGIIEQQKSDIEELLVSVGMKDFELDEETINLVRKKLENKAFRLEKEAEAFLEEVQLPDGYWEE